MYDNDRIGIIQNALLNRALVHQQDDWGQVDVEDGVARPPAQRHLDGYLVEDH